MYKKLQIFCYGNKKLFLYNVMFAFFWEYSHIVQLASAELFISFFFFSYSQPGPSFINLFVQYSQSDLPPLRPLCGEAPARDTNLGRVDLVAGTLTTRPPHLTNFV